ncbi:hypothetical protein HLK59_49805 [Streptomyces sp. S3(2020)]|uniref:hypothetical protein n=1 Tax=Streptomyces sp. S3(2020) TaxID=2732044 RepID=UPI001487AEBF|nr:hypothetical protein [Streptomyces sp. S3(2020)]NNN38259.1 hypothetical protein [Streptomyces sp. S3(2020)]
MNAHRTHLTLLLIALALAAVLSAGATARPADPTRQPPAPRLRPARRPTAMERTPGTGPAR